MPEGATAHASAPRIEPALRTTDPRLPLVVIEAAMEFDEVSKGKSSTFPAARQFADFLRASFDLPVSRITETHYLDIGAAGIVGKALDQSGFKANVKTVGEIATEARAIADKIQTVSTATDGVDYDRLRTFCVAFVNSLLAYRESLRESRPSSSYRR